MLKYSRLRREKQDAMLSEYLKNNAIKERENSTVKFGNKNSHHLQIFARESTKMLLISIVNKTNVRFGQFSDNYPS